MSEVIRVQLREPSGAIPGIEQPQQGADAIRATVHEGAFRSVAGREAQALPHAASASVKSGDAASELSLNGFKALSPAGRVLTDPAEFGETTRFVDEQGRTKNLTNMLTLGLLVKTADGKIALPDPNKQPKHELKEEGPRDTSEVFSPDLQGFYEEIQAHTKSPQATEAILQKTINAAAEGDFTSVGASLAHFGDIKPEEAASVLEAAVVRAAEDVAEHLSKEYDIDGAAAVAHAAAQPQAKRADWMRRIAFGDRSALGEIAESFTRVEFLKECGEQGKK